jgi:hypothetical protein
MLTGSVGAASRYLPTAKGFKDTMSESLNPLLQPAKQSRRQGGLPTRQTALVTCYHADVSE